MTTEAIEAFAERMVRNEVLCCVSALVATLARGYDGCGRGDLASLTEQAYDLAAPVLDYEEAAIEAGWHPLHGIDGHYWSKSGEPEFGTAEEACDYDDIEPHESDVYEHWAVSTWFAEKLAEKGEKVDTDFAGLNVWARQCTGQGIAVDSVVREIARECMSA